MNTPGNSNEYHQRGLQSHAEQLDDPWTCQVFGGKAKPPCLFLLAHNIFCYGTVVDVGREKYVTLWKTISRLILHSGSYPERARLTLKPPPNRQIRFNLPRSYPAARRRLDRPACIACAGRARGRSRPDVDSCHRNPTFRRTSRRHPGTGGQKRRLVGTDRTSPGHLPKTHRSLARCQGSEARTHLFGTGTAPFGHSAQCGYHRPPPRL